MFDPFDREDPALTAEIARVHAYLTNIDPDAEQYQSTVDQLSKLYKLQNETAQLSLQAQEKFASHLLECDKNAWSEEQDELPFWKRVDPSTLVTVAGNLTIALVVIKYEERAVISTKALSFMKKF